MSQIRLFVKEHDYACWCGAKSARVVCGQMFLGRRFAVLQCAACQTQRILPKVLNDQLSAAILYNNYAPPHCPDSVLEQFAQSGLKRLRETEVRFAEGKKVLDVGCGYGILLETLCEQFGCTGKGIDVDRRRIDKARERSRNATFECGLFDAARIGQSYDVILSTAVIEHVADPLDFLKQLNQVLAAGGSLFLLTPNARSLNYRLLRSWWRDLLSIGEHIYLFTPGSLEQCAGRVGFRLVKSSSDFDLARPKLRADTVRNALVSLWAIHRELVKRLACRLASPQTGDILYAHFTKVG